MKSKEHILNVLGGHKGQRFWDIKASSPKTGELVIYGPIFSEKIFEDDISPKAIKDELDALGEIETLNIYINSPGGNAFSGSAIYSILRRYSASKTVYIDGLAASAASVIAMAGDQIVMPANAIMMVHRGWTITLGNAEELRKDAEMLDRVDMAMAAAYQAKSGLEPDKILELMTEETWMTAGEALEYGFADEISEAQDAAAFVDPAIFAKYRNVPENLKNQYQGGGCLSETDRREITEDASLRHKYHVLTENGG